MTPPGTLAEVARRRAAAPAAPLWRPLGEFLDAFYALDVDRPAMLSERPSAEIAADEAAYLAGVAEHLSALYDLAPPAWIEESGFFLDRAYWPEARGRAFEAICLVESPTAFRRRFIFTEAQPLRRKAGPRPAWT